MQTSRPWDRAVTHFWIWMLLASQACTQVLQWRWDRDDINDAGSPEMKIWHFHSLTFFHPSAELLPFSLYQWQTVRNALQTLSPLMSPIQHYSYQDGQRITQNDKCLAWKMCHVARRPAQTLWVYKTWDSHSCEASQEREANDMAVFGMMKHDLVGKNKHSR